MIPVDLNCDATGPRDAPVLLLGGSLGTNLAMWEPQLDALSATHRVIRYDHRGHGDSPVPTGPYTIDELGADVLTLMDRLGIDRMSYCGLSLGGMVGQWLAINAPNRIERLVCICTSPHMGPPQVWHDRAAAVRDAGTPAAVAEAVAGRWFTPDFAAGHPDVVARYVAMVSSGPAEGYASCCEAIATMDLRPGLAGVRAPTLVIAGDQDTSTPAAEHGRLIAEAVPGARFQTVAPAAHLASVQRAGEVTALIAAHLNPTEVR